MNELICMLYCGNNPKHLHAIVNMKPLYTSNEPGVQFQIIGYGLPPGLIGFHVHEKGNLTGGCSTLGPHYNPTNAKHGKLNDPNSHRGDLGNLYANLEGRCEQTITSKLLTLNELVGRSLVIHSNMDDLGRVGDEESLKTGNSGERFCCGIIGYA